METVSDLLEMRPFQPVSEGCCTKRVMKTERNNPKRCRVVSAFTIAETLVAVAIFGIMFASFFGGLSLSLSVVQSARENLRATQIMTENMDVIRLKTYGQVRNTNYTTPFNPIPSNVPSSGAPGLTYTVRVVVATSSPMANGESYSDDVKKVTLQLTWRSGKSVKTNDMITFVSRYGLQTYIPF